MSSAWHPTEPTGNEWYDELYTDSAMLGEGYAEQKHFPREAKRGPKFSCSPELAAAIGLPVDDYEAREWQRRLDALERDAVLRKLSEEHFARVDERWKREGG